MTRQAATRADVASSILGGRKIDCICPIRTIDGRDLPALGEGRTVGFSTSRGITVEQVECSTCGKTWKRINAE